MSNVGGISRKQLRSYMKTTDGVDRACGKREGQQLISRWTVGENMHCWDVRTTL